MSACHSDTWHVNIVLQEPQKNQGVEFSLLLPDEETEAQKGSDSETLLITFVSGTEKW